MRRDRQDWNDPWHSEYDPRDDDDPRERYGRGVSWEQAQRDRGRDYAQNDTAYGRTFAPDTRYERPRDPYFDRGYERERDFDFRERDERDWRYGADNRNARIGEDRAYQFRDDRSFERDRYDDPSFDRDRYDVRDRDRDFRDREYGRDYWDEYPWRSMTHHRRR